MTFLIFHRFELGLPTHHWPKWWRDSSLTNFAVSFHSAKKKWQRQKDSFLHFLVAKDSIRKATRLIRMVIYLVKRGMFTLSTIFSRCLSKKQWLTNGVILISGITRALVPKYLNMWNGIVSPILHSQVLLWSIEKNNLQVAKFLIRDWKGHFSEGVQLADERPTTFLITAVATELSG